MSLPRESRPAVNMICASSPGDACRHTWFPRAIHFPRYSAADGEWQGRSQSVARARHRAADIRRRNSSRPRTENEKVLAEIWQEVLRVDQVGVRDNFFELGGDSIRSIQVLARAQEKGVGFSLQRLFRQPTIEALANTTDQNDDQLDTNLVPFAGISEADRAKMPADVEDAYKIAQLQNGMIFHSDLDEESAIFHDVFSFRLDLPYNREILQKAVERLAQRHTIFRTSFDLGRIFGGRCNCCIRRCGRASLEEDLRGWTEEKQRARLMEFVETEKRNRFDWKKAPMMRLLVQRYTDTTFQFIVSFHHIIMDGWSLAMMLTELFQDYAALLTNKTPGIASAARDVSRFCRRSNRKRLRARSRRSSGERN